MPSSNVFSPSNTVLLQGKDLDIGDKTALVFEGDALALEPGRVQGSVESPQLSLPAFTELVASWNSTTPPGTFVELSLRVRRGTAWSGWFSYGKWSDNGTNVGSIKGQQDEVARLNVDLLQVLAGESRADEGSANAGAPEQAEGVGSSGRAADAVRFKLELTRETPDLDSPRVRLIGFTYAPVPAASSQDGAATGEYTPADVALDVAPRAQLSVPEIGRIICSPTSLATVMAYHGHHEGTEQAAAGAKDNGAGIYGNWSYNVAYAGEKGFTAWVQRCNSMEDVKQYLLRGLPIIASIRITDTEQLIGAESAYPYGHLLVITGLTTEDGHDYVLVNDPSAHEDEGVPRRYRLDQFIKAWTRKIIYVLQPPTD